MPTQALPKHARDAAESRALRRVLILLALLAALFAITAVEHAFALHRGATPWINQLLAASVGADFVHGERATTRYMAVHYVKALSSVGPHMVLGGVALGLGLLQFVPALRRRHRRLHRAIGAVVALAVLASMVGAIGFLAYVPMRQGASGPAFHLGLWALAGLTLVLLVQAGLAAWARDFRAHMVWMALVFAALATAPMLRVDWLLFGWASQRTQEAVNMATGTLVLVQTVLLMTLWLHFVGDRDLPSRPAPASAWPTWLTGLLTALSLLGVLHHGALAALGIDAHAAWRQAADRPALPAVLPWLLGAAATLLLLPRAWGAALRGARPGGVLSAALALAAGGAIVHGLLHDSSSLTRYAAQVFWIGYGLALACALAMARLAPLPSSGRNLWSLLALAFAWLPSQIDGGLLLGRMLGLGFDEAMAAALVNGGGGLLVIGVAMGLAVPFRVRAARPAAVASAASEATR